MTDNHLVSCIFCGEEYDLELDPVDQIENKGFFCDHCQGLTFFNPEDEVANRQFTMFLESKDETNEEVFHKPHIKLKKRLSPLRYPGGKSKVSHFIQGCLRPEKSKFLSSPYVGGGSVEFGLLEAGIVDRLIINDYDFGVYSLFELIRTAPHLLINKLRYASPTHEDFIQARTKIKSYYKGCDMFEAAWCLLLVNRLAYSGIYKANPLGGIRGTKESLLSRWNPDNLCERISSINAMADRYSVMNIDALEFIERYYFLDDSTCLVDPPYISAGEQLYLHYYTEEDHYKLQFLLESLYLETPCADVIVTYDDHPLITQIYEYPEFHRIKRKFSA